MNKVIGLKLTEKDKQLIKDIENSGLSNSELLRKALKNFFKSVNQNYKEKNTKNIEKVNQLVNHFQHEKKEKTVNQVNQSVNPNLQYIENYELLQYLKQDREWLHDRIEHFEHTQDILLSKLDVEPENEDKDNIKSKSSWVRM